MTDAGMLDGQFGAVDAGSCADGSDAGPTGATALVKKCTLVTCRMDCQDSALDESASNVRQSYGELIAKVVDTKCLGREQNWDKLIRDLIPIALKYCNTHV